MFLDAGVPPCNFAQKRLKNTDLKKSANGVTFLMPVFAVSALLVIEFEPPDFLKRLQISIKRAAAAAVKEKSRSSRGSGEPRRSGISSTIIHLTARREMICHLASDAAPLAEGEALSQPAALWMKRAVVCLSGTMGFLLFGTVEEPDYRWFLFLLKIRLFIHN